MASIDSSSTLAQVLAAYDDNASYEEDGSVTKAIWFRTACRILLRRLPLESGTRESHQRLNPDLIQKEMLEAQKWIEANGGATAGGSGSSSGSSGPRVTRTDFRCFRD